jgi:RHS repeat-associated protein
MQMRGDTSLYNLFDFYCYTYDVAPIGMTEPTACSSALRPPVSCQFTGKERDDHTGLDYFLARYYSGAQGRFLSPDEFKGGIVDPFTGQQISQPGPLPYADISNPQTLNKYAYVMNNPLRYTDPDGHIALVGTWGGAAAGTFICGPVCTVVGAIVGTAAAAVAGYEAGKAIGGAIRREQARDEKGKFTATTPGDTKPGSESEKKALDAMGATKNTKPETGTIHDGTMPDGQRVEVKSGGTVSNTEQLRKMGKAAVDATGRPSVVVTTNPNVRVSAPAQNNPNLIIKPLKQQQ